MVVVEVKKDKSRRISKPSTSKHTDPSQRKTLTSLPISDLILKPVFLSRTIVSFPLCAFSPPPSFASLSPLRLVASSAEDWACQSIHWVSTHSQCSYSDLNLIKNSLEIISYFPSRASPGAAADFLKRSFECKLYSKYFI